MSKHKRTKTSVRSNTRKNRRSWVFGLTAAVAIMIVLGVVAALKSNSGGGVENFSMVAYQGENVLGGNDVSFASLFNKGQTKPVVLNFWGGTCPPCRAEMPGIQHVYDSLKGQFIMVGVDVGPYMGLGTHADARQLLQSLHITYPAAYATNNPIPLYNIDGLPTTIMFSPQGKIFDKHIGYFTEDQFRTVLQNLITKSSPTS